MTWGLKTVPTIRKTITPSSQGPVETKPQLAFKGHDDILSNFYKAPMKYGGNMYPSVENCYQALKFKHHKLPSDKIEEVARESDPYKVKQLGNEIATDESWETTKLDTMHKLVVAKAQQCPDFAKYLLSTEGQSLVHTVSDQEWGYDGNRGLNTMGNLLEEIRNALVLSANEKQSQSEPDADDDVTPSLHHGEDDDEGEESTHASHDEYAREYPTQQMPDRDPDQTLVMKPYQASVHTSPLITKIKQVGCQITNAWKPSKGGTSPDTTGHNGTNRNHDNDIEAVNRKLSLLQEGYVSVLDDVTKHIQDLTQQIKAPCRACQDTHKEIKAMRDDNKRLQTKVDEIVNILRNKKTQRSHQNGPAGVNMNTGPKPNITPTNGNSQTPSTTANVATPTANVAHTTANVDRTTANVDRTTANVDRTTANVDRTTANAAQTRQRGSVTPVTSTSSSESDCDASASHSISTSLNVRDPCRTRRKPEIILVCDSIPKYVDGEEFFGKQKTAIRRLGTATQAVHAIKQWSKEGSVTSFITHLGVNDIRDSTPAAELSDNLVSLMKTAAETYPRATIAFSEILGVGSNRDMNRSVHVVNMNISSACHQHGWLYIRHKKLTSDDQFFEDEVHITKDRGTKLFVADITRSVRALSNKSDTGHARSDPGCRKQGDTGNTRLGRPSQDNQATGHANTTRDNNRGDRVRPAPANPPCTLNRQDFGTLYMPNQPGGQPRSAQNHQGYGPKEYRPHHDTLLDRLRYVVFGQTSHT